MNGVEKSVDLPLALVRKNTTNLSRELSYSYNEQAGGQVNPMSKAWPLCPLQIPHGNFVPKARTTLTLKPMDFVRSGGFTISGLPLSPSQPRLAAALKNQQVRLR